MKINKNITILQSDDVSFMIDWESDYMKIDRYLSILVSKRLESIIKFLPKWSVLNYKWLKVDQELVNDLFLFQLLQDNKPEGISYALFSK